MRALARILGGAGAGLALFALLGYLGMHFDWLNRGVRMDAAGIPVHVLLPRSAWEFGAAIALAVALAGWAAVRHLRSATDPGVGAVVAAVVVLAACIVLFGTSGAQQAARLDPAFGVQPPLFARVLWHGASNAGSYAAIGVLGCVALLSRRPAPARALHRDDTAAYRRPVP